MTEQKKSDMGGCGGCLLGLSLAMGPVYFVLWLLGVAVPQWVLIADGCCFAAGLLIMGIEAWLSRGKGKPGQEKDGASGQNPGNLP